MIVLDEACGNGGSAPTHEGDGDDNVGTETLDSGDPEDLSDDVRDEEESDQVAELVVDQTDILLEAEDTGVSQIGEKSEGNLMVLNGLSDCKEGQGDQRL